MRSRFSYSPASSNSDTPARGLIFSVVPAAAGGLPTSAAAMGQVNGPSPTPELQEIVVTGSYIPRTDSETVSPVTIISSADITNSGLTTVADVVRTLSADNSGTLPTAFPGAFAAGASGVA